MQILLSMKPEKPLVIPFNCNYQLQSSLYRLLGTVGESDFWHDTGFGDISKYKGFCFGKLGGRYRADIQNKKLCFENSVYLEIRSASFDFIDAFQRAVESHPFLKLYDTQLSITAASLTNIHLKSGRAVFEAVTPVAVHTTLEDGHTIYYSPDDDEFFNGICDNAEKKYRAVTGKRPDEICIRQLGSFKKTVTLYKNTYITGYTGKIEIDTTLKMAEFLFNSGLGEKNSQGFGFVNLADNM